jgi:hypothetical protein
VDGNNGGGGETKPKREDKGMEVEDDRDALHFPKDDGEEMRKAVRSKITECNGTGLRKRKKSEQQGAGPGGSHGLFFSSNHHSELARHRKRLRGITVYHAHSNCKPIHDS